MLINIAIFTVGAIVGALITLGLAALSGQLDHDADAVDVEYL